MSAVRLGSGVEFDVIRSILEGATASDRVRVGPGDDAVVLEGGIVLSTDVMVEAVHFRSGWLEPEEIGYRAAAAALSDLAAMAAEPVGVLVSLAVAKDPASLGPAVMEGVRSAVEGLGGTLLGGDLSASPGPLVVDVVAVGRAETPLLRRGSEPGDSLWVTGVLGGAAGAVKAWSSGERPSADLRSAFARPVPRVREAGWLRSAAGIHALIDVSDGVAGDAGHLAAASDVRVVLEEDRIPVHPALEASAKGFPERDESSPASEEPGPSLQLALFGGEDYELLFTAEPGRVESVADEFRARFDVHLTRIGTIEEGSGVHLRRTDGAKVPLDRGGYDHFGQGAGEAP